MKILFVADGRSPTTLSWMGYWVENGYQVHLISTFPCNEPAGLKSFSVIPVAFSNLSREQINRVRKSSGQRRWTSNLRGLLRLFRYYLGPFELLIHQKNFRRIIADLQPEIVHALRIPFEGMLGSFTPKGIPYVQSIWGNDLTLHALGSPFMAVLTKQALKRADALIADTERDICLGHKWGFPEEKPSLVVPGSGGIHLDLKKDEEDKEKLPEKLADGPLIVNPRGQRPGSLRQDVFFRSIPLVLKMIPNAIFVCPSLQGDREAEHLVDDLGIWQNTKLWPHLTQRQLWSLFGKAQIFVSPSLHDGTPNSLLETMAAGCFPVVGNIESMREWVKPWVNGALVDAKDANSIANAIVQAINQPELRLAAAKMNADLITRRADYANNMSRVENVYKLISTKA